MYVISHAASFNLTNVRTPILMTIFIQRMETYCIWPHFSRKLTHVFICKLPLWVYKIPSAYTANIYLIERQGYAFMLFVFWGIRTCKEKNITGMTVSTLKFFCRASVSQVLRVYFNSNVCCIPTETFWKFDYMMTSGTASSGEIWAMYTPANDVVELEWIYALEYLVLGISCPRNFWEYTSGWLQCRLMGWLIYNPGLIAFSNVISPIRN